MLQPAEATATRTGSLAERLDRGPVPLPKAVRYAYDISKSLRELHRDGRTHGSVNCRNIELSGSGAVLHEAENSLPGDQYRKDIQGFGWVLRALFPEDAEVASATAGFAATGVATELKRMTARCLADPLDADWTMKHIVSELRLHYMAVRQWENTASSLVESSHPTPKIWRAPELQQAEEKVIAPTVAPAPTRPAVPAQKPASHPALQLETSRLEPKISSVRCPRCTATYVHPSTPRTHFEDALVALGKPVMRCHRCSYRYFKFLKITISKGGER